MLAFIAAIFKAPISWPTALVILVWLLRGPLLALLPELDTLRGKNFEPQFRKKLKEVGGKAKVVLLSDETTATGERQGERGEERALTLLAEVSPRAAIVESWFPVESALQAAAARYAIPPATPPTSILCQLSQQQKIEPALGKIFEELRALHTQAVQAPELALLFPSDAKAFAQLASRLARRVREL